MPTPRPMFHPRLEALDERTVPAAGDLDPTFGNGGIAAPDLGQTFFVRDTLIQPDGKILSIGTTPAVQANNGSYNSPFMLVRHNPDGSLDSSFGSGGVVT